MKKKAVLILLMSTLLVTNLYSNEDYRKVLSLSENQNNSNVSYQPLADWHIYTGYAALGLSVLAGVLNPKNVSEELHCAVGWAASGMSAVSMGLGAGAYGVAGLGAGEGITDPHVVLGIAGGTLVVASSIIVELGGHEPVGMIGTALMGASILFELDF